jgi:hypothetical protein
MCLSKRTFSFLTALLFIGSNALFGQSERNFSIPLDQLKNWSDQVVTSMNVDIAGNSKVHAIGNDCEMHFGAKMPGFRGEPDGIVLEPMNLCVEPFPGKSSQANRDWEEFGRGLKGARVRAEGVPRIWPEHLIGGSDSNPDHAVEIHPMTKLQRGNEVLTFSGFIFAPEGFDGGVGEATARKIVSETEVAVTENDGLVEINFHGGRIGNFTTLEVTFNTNDVQDAPGGHRMRGQIVLDRANKVATHLLTVAGSEIDSTITKLKNSKRNRRISFDALVLFSLSPEALFKAAKESNGKQVSVENPLQLIIFGQPDEDAQKTE